MNAGAWRILLVDDDEEDYLLTRATLADARQGRFTLEWASSYERGLAALRAGGFDAALMDFDLGGQTGIDLIRAAAEWGCPTPIILLTGRGSFAVGLEAMQAGALDYLNKADLNPELLERAIRYAIERKRAELALAATSAQAEASRQELAEIVENISDSFFTLDRDYRFLSINRRAASSRGRAPESLTGKNLWEEFPDLLGTELERRYRLAMETRQAQHFEWPSVSGPPAWFEVNVYPSSQGISVHSVNITARKHTERSLRESQDLLRLDRDLFTRWIETTGSIFWRMGPTGEVHEPQPGFQAACGLSWEECRGWGWLNAIHPDDRPEASRYWRQAVAAGAPLEYELRLWSAARQEHCWFLVRGVPHTASDGGILAWIGAAIDIQERKRAQQALERERELLQMIFANIPVMIVLYHPQIAFIQVNESFTRLTGWTSADAREGDLMTLCYPDPQYRAEVRDFMTSLEPGWRDFFLTTRSGEELESSWTNLRLSDDTQVGIGIDIRERKQAEQALVALNSQLQQQKQALEAKNQQLAGLFDNAPAGMVLFDAEPPYRIISHNRVQQQMLSEPYYTRGAVGAALTDILPSAGADGLLAIFEEVATGGQARTFYNYPINGLGNQVAWWNWTLSPVMLAGRVVALAHMSVDISETVWARRAQEAERAFLQAVLDQLPVAVVIVQAGSGSLLYANEQVEKTWRRPLDPLPQPAASWGFSGFFPDGRAYESAEQPIARALRGEVVRGEEIVILRGDGSYGVVQADASPVRSPGGELLAGVAVFVDITERKRAERDTLFLSELGETLNFTTDDEAILAKVCQMTGSHLDCTRCMFIQFDEAAGQFVVRRDYALGLQSGEGTYLLDCLSPVVRAALQAGQPFVNRDTQLDPLTAPDYETYYAPGSHRSVLAVPLLREGRLAAILAVSDNRPRLWNDRQIVFLQVVAERAWATYETRRLLAALRASDERFRLASRAIDGYIYDYDLAGGQLVLSEGFERLTGFPSAAMSDYQAWLARVHPDDRPSRAPERLLAEASRHGGMFAGELRFQRASGEWITLLEQAMLINDASGRPQRLVGIAADITSRKQMEASLRQSEERALQLAEQASLNAQMLGAVIDSMREGVLLSDLQGRLTRINPAAVALHGFASEERMMQGWQESLDQFELHDADDQPVPLEQWPLVNPARETSVINLELHVRRRDTGRAWIGLYSAIPVRDRQGQNLFVLNTVVDITQVRLAEQQRGEMDSLLKVQRLLVAQREQERLQIARDLHDGPIQELIGLRFAIQSALELAGDGPLADILHNLQHETQALVGELRGVCNELRPPVLLKFGLARAIRSYVEELRGRGAPPVSLALDDDSDRLSDEARLTLYRICQESLNNIVRHANASQASVRLRIEAAQLTLEVQDNGTGFSLPADWLQLAREGHLGLVGMKERAEAIGASVEIQSAAGSGTQLRVRLPLNPETAGPRGW